MASRDIMPWISPLGGTYEVRWGSMTAGEVFEVGEPIGVVDAGTLTEPAGATASVVVGDFDGGTGGIAAYGPGAGNIDPATGAAMATGASVPFWPFGQGTQFITDNFFATGDTTTAVVPAQTDVGEHYKMNQAAAATAWGLEQTAALSGVDLVCRVTEVLDVNFAPIRITSAAGVYLVFEIDAPTLAAA